MDRFAGLALARPTSASPKLTATIYIIPVEDRRFLVYAPLRRVAFVTNSGMIKLLTRLRDGFSPPGADAEASAMDFLRRLELVDSSSPELDPVSRYAGPPQPTSITLFLTTACNLRCTYCYASAGDHPARFTSSSIHCPSSAGGVNTRTFRPG